MLLSSDGKELIITNRIPVRDANAENFVSETAKDLTPNLGDIATIENTEYFRTMEPSGLTKQIEKLDVEEKFREEYCLPDQETQFQNVKSNSSCYIKDIKAFIFGGFSSRFWILRKHICSLEKEDLKNLPFYSWNCITIKTTKRDIDLVIKDDQQMKILIKFLVYSINTLDGHKNSALPLLKICNEQEEAKVKKFTGQMNLTPAQTHRISHQNKQKIYSQICRKYDMLRVRAKISFMAFDQGKTIEELFVNAIWKTYMEFLN